MVNAMEDLVIEALFVSDLQPSQRPSADIVRAAVDHAIERYGSVGCAAAVAAEFGDHPETAVRRMGWVRSTLAAA